LRGGLTLDWTVVCAAYFCYLGVTSVATRAPRRTRGLSLAAAGLALTALALPASARAATPVWVEALVPAGVLLGGYWISGTFFTGPMPALERTLLRIDDVVLRRTGVLGLYASAPRTVSWYFELSYLLVYVLVPAGAVTLVLGGFGAEVGRYWTVVLAAEFVAYGALPWLQTRPPRALEATAAPVTAARRLNMAVLGRGSIQANTIPSGHAAGAVAAALAVGQFMPAAGGCFLAIAASIVVATVVGRYHFALDSALGVLVALLAWASLS
jgi:hypothetical protein